MMKNDLAKSDLYEAVKMLVELDDKHLHFSQHKLFTLFSIAFQYFLYSSTKNPGAYIIRLEDSHLAEKLAKKSKDPSTRKFIQSILLPRKLKYGNSTFYLDFFHIGSWHLTKEIPEDRIKGALIAKNTSSKPMFEMTSGIEEDGEEIDIMANLPKDFYLAALKEYVPKTITIAYEVEFDGLRDISFPFIKKDENKTVKGVTLSKDIDWDNLDATDLEN